MVVKKEKKMTKDIEYNLKMMFLLVLVLCTLLIYQSFQVSKLIEENEQLQERLNPTTHSVAFIKCDDGTLLNLLTDINNLTIYDYNIRKGCEIIQ